MFTLRVRKKSTFLLFLLITLLLYTVGLPNSIDANSLVISRSQWGADPSVIKTSNELYKQVNNIRIAKITAPNSSVSLNTEDWIRGLYYYFTVIKGMKDIPFNYLVGWDGRIYEGANGGSDVQVQSQDKIGTLVIAYLSDGNDISSSAQSTLTTFIKKTATQDHIPSAYIIPSDWAIVSQDGNNSIQFTNTEDSSWNSYITNIKVALGYKPNSTVAALQIPHSATVDSISFCSNKSSCSINAGEILTINLNITNTGDVNIYSPLSVVANTFKNSVSPMYDSNSWQNTTTANSVFTSRIELKQVRSLSFNIKVPVSRSNWKENFYITTGGNKISGTDFTLDLTKPQ